jgi:hypothetical protein
MKKIYLWVTNEGWAAFDYDDPKTKEALTERNIIIGNYAKSGIRK